ncbi:prokaryotic cytochrome b561 [Roseovarius mucosus]|uniref:Prokaryotic cytochrome b561 n=1 Tax=Roseovarius mucosus TaxID=215743 RepID=A0A1V0RRL1_9RHOB|nr:cytochrome b/b6 domain-containing protein [Roseovarius mucosus]ARE84336.1 prokaryotic cytochrome b561 [Roseovarius mucosus]
MSDAKPQAAGQAGIGRAAEVRVWDPVVRLFHWSLVTAFAVAWLSAEDLDRLHEIVGYVVIGLIVLRVIWGLVGGRYARFSQFIKGPRATMSYLGDIAKGTERRYLGHNPAGAAMVVALLVTLSGTAVSGWLMAEPGRLALLPDMPQIVAPAWADDDGAYDGGAEDLLEEVHETLANLMLVFAALHVGGVVLASVRHRENLVRAMVTGDKRAPETGDVA